jgi:hypothetical protein
MTKSKSKSAPAKTVSKETAALRSLAAYRAHCTRAKQAKDRATLAEVSKRLSAFTSANRKLLVSAGATL